jgi:CRP-like cAMP-binding protein
MFGPGSSPADLDDVLENYEIKQVRAGEAIITEREEGYDIYVIRQGSMVVERTIGGKPVFLSYLRPAPMSARWRCSTAAADRDRARGDQVGSDQAGWRARPAPARRQAEAAGAVRADMSRRRQLNSFIEAKKDSFGSVVDMYSRSRLSWSSRGSARRPTCC